MSSALDFAKYFIKNGFDTQKNTFDGNMKLQKLLFFANFISLVEKKKPLYNDTMYAFYNGCVIESVRLRYKYDYANLYAESLKFDPDFSKDEYDVVNLTKDLLGDLSAKELSDLNHTFDFWSSAFKHSTQDDGYKNKDMAVVSVNDILKEAHKMQLIIDQFKSNVVERQFKEVVNGVTFYYSAEFEMTDSVLAQLIEFSKEAEENVYSIYMESDNLVIF